MPVNIHDLINVLAQICDDKQLKASFTESLKGGLLTGFSTLIGGLLMGRSGLALGAVTGGILAYMTSSDDLKPVSEILRNMDHSKKQLLYSRIKNAFQNIGPEDLTALIPLILSQKSFTDLAIKEVKNFISSELNAKVLY